MVNKAWRIIPRSLLETVLNNHAQHHRVPQPLILHGPRGVGKTTLILERLMGKWNSGPHITGYIDFAESVKDHHPIHGQSFPWGSWSNCSPPSLPFLTTQLETCLESMTRKGIKLGTISSHQIFAVLSKWHGISTALKQILNGSNFNPRKAVSVGNNSVLNLWERAVFASSVRLNAQESGGLSLEEETYYREATSALNLAKEVIRVQQKWSAKAIKHLNQTGGFSRSLANSATDWPCLLLELLSSAAEIDYFQPKLVINNIEVLKNAMRTDDSTVCASMYHDSLIWRIIALGANERSLPVILVTSDSYYSYRAYMDFGFPDIFISRETFGWTPAEAKMHMVGDYFSQSEWNVIVEVVGPNPRHLFEIYALKLSNYYQKVMSEKSSKFEDIVDAYLAYLQVNYLADCSLEIFDDPSAIALLEVGLLYSQRDPSFLRPVSRGIQRCLVRWLVQERIQLHLKNSLQYLWQRVIRGRSYRHLMLEVGYK
ncbi:uncharacterized protein LOC107852525 isoform X3 [Capsicum annuum]|uniref:uncharacterized protein LOC107852525 isoform X3 n=1 Tax=Capsicum annuum TaxID=4072 RepID=UPI0007BF8D1C|nr:uncharacterized protein LOC107852525 isoform X3 [Capsicum annuum]